MRGQLPGMPAVPKKLEFLDTVYTTSTYKEHLDQVHDGSGRGRANENPWPQTSFSKVFQDERMKSLERWFRRRRGCRASSVSRTLKAFTMEKAGEVETNAWPNKR